LHAASMVEAKSFAVPAAWAPAWLAVASWAVVPPACNAPATNTATMSATSTGRHQRGMRAGSVRSTWRPLGLRGGLRRERCRCGDIVLPHLVQSLRARRRCNATLSQRGLQDEDVPEGVDHGSLKLPELTALHAHPPTSRRDQGRDGAEQKHQPGEDAVDGGEIDRQRGLLSSPGPGRPSWR
jgi:hypothetical protein